jgi:hypothetical protein
MPRPVSRAARARVPAESLLRQVRIPFVQRATLRREGVVEDAFIVDLGLFGVFVEHAGPLAVGTEADIEFPLPGNEIPLRAHCRVAWAHAPGGPLLSKALPAGVGLQFVEVSRENHARLRAHLVEYLQGAPSQRRFRRQWPEPGDGS